MEGLLSAALESYLLDHVGPEPPLLQALARETHAMVLQSRMLSGHVQGRLLSLISKLIRPNYILEVGAYTGYSALCLAEGLQPQGKLLSLEVNEEFEERILRYFAQSPQSEQLRLMIGDAKDLIPSLPDGIDLAFVDADKKSNALYVDLLHPKMQKGGLILVDNVLWSGKVLDPEAQDKATLALKSFNATFAKDPRFESIILPIRDGITLLRVV